MAKVLMLLAVEYDETRTGPEALADALDRVFDAGWAKLAGQVTDDLGRVGAGEFYPSTHNPEHPHRLDCRLQIRDKADELGPPLPIHVFEDEYGVTLDVAGAVAVDLDYHNGRLQVVLYNPDADDPYAVYTVPSTVIDALAEARKGDGGDVPNGAPDADVPPS